MKLADKILTLAKQRDMTQAQLARAIGTYPSRVSDWVTQRGYPSVEQALKIARVLGVTLDFLADETQEVQPQTSTDFWEQKILEVVRELGPYHAWRRIIGVNAELKSIEGPPGYELGGVDPGPDESFNSKRGTA